MYQRASGFDVQFLTTGVEEFQLNRVNLLIITLLLKGGKHTEAASVNNSVQRSLRLANNLDLCVLTVTGQLHGCVLLYCIRDRKQCV